jgi:dephospho-CoA kinase
MLMVGLTGGIGAGKSAVAARLKELGAVLIDADALARAALAPGTDALAEVAAVFGVDLVGPDGALDRPALARRVFGDDAARRRLEDIVHPRVREQTARLIAAAPPDAIVVNDVPLLVEANLAAAYDIVVVVVALIDVRIDRLARTRQLSRDEAYARIRSQASDDQRQAVADVLINNDGTLADLVSRVDEVWNGILLPARETGG